MSNPILSHAAAEAVDGERTLFQVSLRLMPFMMFMYVLAYLDRINLGFAADAMKADLGLSNTAYGIGSGIFFVGYFLFEVPSNLIMERVGARRWMARIMVSWGIIASAMMFVRGPRSLYAVRLLLGIAEAGFFPGMVLYLTYWIPARQRARSVAVFLAATALAGVVGGPLSGAILHLNGVHGWKGWQWLFLLEGLPSVVGGFAVLFCLTDRPAQATWLTAAQRAWLEAELAAEREAQAQARARSHHSLWTALQDLRLWLLSCIYFVLMVGLYGFGYWFPLVVKGIVPGTSDSKIAYLSAVPYALAAVAMSIVGHHSDRTGERIGHLAASALCAMIGLALVPFCHSLTTAIAAFSLAAMGIWSTLGPFWVLPTHFLRGTAAAGGIATVNSLGCLAGFFGQIVIGKLRDQTHSFTPGIYFVAACMLAAALLVLVLPRLASCTSE